MRAWWAYWATVIVAAVVWIAPLVVDGRDGLGSMLANPLGVAVLVLPIAAAGLNLVLYRQRHEEVCRIEVERHRSFRLVAGDGYSATMFAATGVVLLAVATVIVVLQVFQT